MAKKIKKISEVSFTGWVRGLLMKNPNLTNQNEREEPKSRWPNLLCTIVCDASFCPETKVGGWAAWIVCNDVRLKLYAPFKEKCLNSSDAEIKAAINGLVHARNNFKNVSRYHFVIDCDAAIRYIECRNNEWRELIEKIAGDSEITVKHVRGHKQDGTSRSWVNGWCDRKARKAMRLVRLQYKTNS